LVHVPTECLANRITFLIRKSLLCH